MTLIEALRTLESKGITKLVGMYNKSDIKDYIDNAVEGHEDNHYIIETNGRFIIATRYEGFDMATYGNYETEAEMHVAFDEYEINKQAEEIATLKTQDDSSIPFEIWKSFAVSELKAAYAASHEAFECEYGNA